MSMRIYEIYGIGNRLSNKSSEYSRLRDTLYHVAAFSIKQAYYLAYNHQWTNGHLAGIAEMRMPGDNAFWYRWSGRKSIYEMFAYNSTFPKSAIDQGDVRDLLIE